MFNNILTDPVMWIYTYDMVICLAGFIIFLWWWIRLRTASEVYAYITFLLLATAVERLIALSVRALMYYDIEKAGDALNSLAWILRTIPGTVIMGLIVLRMALRACRTLRLERKYRGPEEPICIGGDIENNGKKSSDSR